MEQVELPPDIHEHVRAICLALPEVTVRVDESLVHSRSTAYSYEVRKRSFCVIIARPAPLVVLRVDPDERDELLAIGHPFFAARRGGDRIAVWLGDHTDWDEMRELITDSYRRLAPKKLSARLD